MGMSSPYRLSDVISGLRRLRIDVEEMVRENIGTARGEALKEASEYISRAIGYATVARDMSSRGDYASAYININSTIYSLRQAISRLGHLLETTEEEERDTPELIRAIDRYAAVLENIADRAQSLMRKPIERRAAREKEAAQARQSSSSKLSRWPNNR